MSKIPDKAAKRVFCYALNQLITKESEYDFFELLILKVIPLIKCLWPEQVEAWEKKINEYEPLQSRAHEDGLKTLNALKEDLISSNLIEHPEIKLSFSTSADPYMNLEPLLRKLLDLGHEEIVEKYVNTEINIINKQIRKCFKCGLLAEESPNQPFNEIEPPCIRCGSDHFFTDIHPISRKGIKRVRLFIPSYKFNSLVELNDRRHDYWLNTLAPYSAWHYLILAEESWQSKFDFLKGKQLSGEKLRKTKNITPQKILKAIQRDGKLMTVDIFRREMKILQSDGEKSRRTFTRQHFEKCMSSVQSVLFEDAVAYDQLDLLQPLSLSLSVGPRDGRIHTALRLNIEWIQGLEEVLCLHYFHPGIENSAAKKYNLENEYVRQTDYMRFAYELIARPGKATNEIDDHRKSAAEYLHRIGISGILRKIFISSTAPKTATLRAVKVEGKNLSSHDLKQLHAYLNSANFFKWVKIPKL